MAQERSNLPVFLKEIELQSKYEDKPTKVNLYRALYQSNLRYALIATIAEENTKPQDQVPYATLSTNLDNWEYYADSPDEVAIKNYSENKGFLQQLINQGIVSQPLHYVESGFVTIPICKLLIQPNNGLDQSNAS